MTTIEIKQVDKENTIQFHAKVTDPKKAEEIGKLVAAILSQEDNDKRR